MGLRRKRELSLLVRPLYGLSSLEGIGKYLVAETGRLIVHESLVICDGNQSTGRSVYHAHSIGEDLRERESIIDRFLHQNPLIRYYLKCPGANAIRNLDIISPAEWKKTELYHEGLGPLGIYEQLGTKLPSAQGTIRGFMLNRDRCGFSDQDVEIFDRLKDHVGAAIMAAEQWERIDRGSPAGGNRATVVLDAAGRVLFRSPEAAPLLDSCTGPFRSALPEIVDRWMRREISRFDSVELWSHPRMPLVLEKNGRTLTLRLLSSEEGGHMILIASSERPHPGNHGCDRLTVREKEVLSWIAWGKTNSEIAEILGMSIHTVKNHVKRILSMLGVDNRTSAAALLLQEQAER